MCCSGLRQYPGICKERWDYANAKQNQPPMAKFLKPKYGAKCRCHYGYENRNTFQPRDYV